MSNKRYTEEFKIEAVKQITERVYAVFGITKPTQARSFNLSWHRLSFSSY